MRAENDFNLDNCQEHCIKQYNKVHSLYKITATKIKFRSIWLCVCVDNIISIFKRKKNNRWQIRKDLDIEITWRVKDRQTYKFSEIYTALHYANASILFFYTKKLQSELPQIN